MLLLAGQGAQRVQTAATQLAERGERVHATLRPAAETAQQRLQAATEQSGQRVLSAAAALLATKIAKLAEGPEAAELEGRLLLTLTAEW